MLSVIQAYCALYPLYRVDGVDVAQEAERNKAAARHSWARQHTWLLLSSLCFLCNIHLIHSV